MKMDDIYADTALGEPAVIPALPGYSVCKPMMDVAGKIKTIIPIPIIAWIIRPQMRTKNDRLVHPEIFPVTLESTNYGSPSNRYAIKQPDGTYVISNDDETVRSEQEVIACWREQDEEFKAEFKRRQVNP